MNSPAEIDMLRFIVAMAEVRDDEDAVKQVIDAKLAVTGSYLHAALLRVALRVTVAQFYAPVARRLDDELDYDFTDMALNYQRCVNAGEIAERDDEVDVSLRQILDGA